MNEEGREKISAAAQKRYANSSQIVNCPVCKKEYKQTLSQQKNGRGKYCSRLCKGIASRGVRPASSTEFKKGQKPWNAGLAKYKACEECGKNTYISPSMIKRGKGKYCSVECRSVQSVRKYNCINCSKEFDYSKRGTTKAPKYCSNKCQGEHLSAENSPQWVGDDIGYHGVHSWVESKLGKPMLCTQCGTTDSKRFHWHNIPKTYKRDLGDWVRLCPKCHAHIHKNWEARWKN